MSDYYAWFKALHIISMTAWMAGMFYLPRLFVYHADVKAGSKEDERFKTMERRLLKIIMNPAMLATIVFGLLLSHIYGFYALGSWFYIKMFFVLILGGLHGYFSHTVKIFAKGNNKKTSTFYKCINEIPTVAFVIIVIMVVVKPFE